MSLGDNWLGVSVEGRRSRCFFKQRKTTAVAESSVLTAAVVAVEKKDDNAEPNEYVAYVRLI